MCPSSEEWTRSRTDWGRVETQRLDAQLTAAIYRLDRLTAAIHALDNRIRRLEDPRKNRRSVKSDPCQSDPTSGGGER